MAVDKKALVEAVTKELNQQGKLIEAGWMSFKIFTLPPHASEAQIDDMRMAFFAGAQHLWGSMHSIMDQGDDEPTAGDMNHMDAINNELGKFVIALRARVKAMGH